MVTFARGVAKTVAIAEETTLGTQASGSGQLLRRLSSDLNLNIQPIESQEILPSQQVRDYRNGPRQVGGTLSGQLSPSTYKSFFKGILRKDFTTGVATSAITDTVLTNTTPGTTDVTLTSTGTNFLTAGFKKGDVVRITGASGGSAVVNNLNLRVKDVTTSPNKLTFYPHLTPVGWASGQTVTITVFGKKAYVPATGQVFPSFSVEHWYSDVTVSDLFLGCRPTQMSLNIPASGFVTMSTSFVGLSMTTSGTQVYSSATAATTTTSLTAVDGKLGYNGSDVAYVTGMNLQIAPEVQTMPVVGSNTLPDIFMGTLRVRGSMTALFAGGDSFQSDFLAENELTLSMLLTTGPASNADYIHLFLPRVKLSAATKNDSDRAIMRSFNFVGLEQTAGGTGTAFDQTSIVVQDSLA